MAKDSLIDELRKGLSEAKMPEKKVSARQIILSLMPEIIQRRNDGARLDDLVAWFAEHGVTTTRSTLGIYIGEYKKQQMQQASGVGRTDLPKSAGVVKNPFREPKTDAAGGPSLRVFPDL